MTSSARRRAKKASSHHESEFDGLKFEPQSQTQAEARNDFEDEGKHLLLTGYAGTGKTYLAVALALKLLRDGEIKQIRVFRSAVSSREIGFLPGTEEEKLAVFEHAIRPIFNELMRRGDAYDLLKNKDMLVFESTSYQRGMNYKDTCLIVDEVQNLSWTEIDTLVTRLHDSSRIILMGDSRQADLRDSQSGFARMTRVVERILHRVAHHKFGIDDILRGGLVKDWIVATEKEFENQLVEH
jgi:phosphate starvation-inducible PhoH-like protein